MSNLQFLSFAGGCQHSLVGAMAMAGIDLCRPLLADAFVGNEFFPFCLGVVTVAGEGTGVHQLLPDFLDLVEITHNVLLWRL